MKKTSNSSGSWKTAVEAFNDDVRKRTITYTVIENWFEKNYPTWDNVINDLDQMIAFLDELKDRGYAYKPTPEEMKKSPESAEWLKHLE